MADDQVVIYQGVRGSVLGFQTQDVAEQTGLRLTDLDQVGRGSVTGEGSYSGDLAGARQVRETMPEARFVFLAPPDWDTLVQRLVGRGTEDAEERERRLATARVELAAESEFDVTIVNDSVERAADELAALLGVRDLT